MQKDINSHAMGQYQSTKYNLSSETAQNYGDVINAAAPYLEEYDEIYVITEADIRALGLPTKEEDIEKLDKSKVVQAIIGHGDILDRLRENGDNEQLSQLEKQLPPLLLPRIRSSLALQTSIKSFIKSTGLGLSNGFFQNRFFS